MERTADEVRAELRLVRRRITAFETMVSQAERLGMAVDYFTNTVGNTVPSGLRGTFGADNVWAWQVADELARIQRLLGSPELVECPQSLGLGLQQLVSQLRLQELNLCRELAALEPPEAEAAGLFERVVQAAQHALSFGHPA